MTLLPVFREFGAALLAVQFRADAPAPAFRGDHPRPVDPRRPVPHVLRMAALEIGNPIVSFVLMKADDASFHDLDVSRIVWNGATLAYVNRSFLFLVLVEAPPRGEALHECRKLVAV